MATVFEVESVILSDYSSQEVSGKSIYAGVYGGEIVFASTPNYFPPLIFNLTIRPISQTFAFEIRFNGPNTSSLLVFDAGFKSQTQVNEFARVSYNIQFPVFKFDGPGLYSLEIGLKGKKANYRKIIRVLTEPGPVMPNPDLTLKLRSMADSVKSQI